jgi:LmbE family N-acetylglucosaminyl deacetylase
MEEIMPEASGSQRSQEVERIVRELAAEVFRWASGEAQAPVIHFVPKLTEAIEEALKNYDPGTTFLVRVHDTRLGYDSGGCYTFVEVKCGDELIVHPRILLDENARRLYKMIRDTPRTQRPNQENS